MNLKRHHVLYVFLAVSLILALLVFLTPAVPSVSFIGTTPAQVDTTASQHASSTISAIHFEVVTTEADQERGLSGRVNVPENYGMLFVFAQPVLPGFWMKDMLTSIDIIWLSDTGEILGIEDSVSPNTYPKSYYPPKPVSFVLETRAGEARRRGWTVSSIVPLPAPYN